MADNPLDFSNVKPAPPPLPNRPVWQDKFYGIRLGLLCGCILIPVAPLLLTVYFCLYYWHKYNENPSGTVSPKHEWI